MTKSIGGAQTGTLTLFVGGPKKLPDQIAPAIGAMASEIRMVGSVGAAKALKLVNNMVVSCLDVAICEALLLGQQHGISYEAITTALSAHGADSWPLHAHIINHVLPDDLGPGFFSTQFLMKDLTLATEMVSSYDVPAPFAGLALAFYRGASAHGFGDDYHMVVIRWLERCANVPQGRFGSVDGRGGESAIAIARGVAAVQAMVSLDALRVLDPMPLTLS